MRSRRKRTRWESSDIDEARRVSEWIERINRTNIRRFPTTKSFHSLRHSFNSALANAGVGRQLRQVLTGHASERMNESYTHSELEPIRNAIESMPNV